MIRPPPLRPASRASRASLALALATAGALSAGCSMGGGTGSIKGELHAPDCWSGPFDLQPDFYAADAYEKSLQIRIQQSRDFQAFSDGVSILVDDLTQIRGAGPSNRLGQALTVSLPPEVTPPGVPVEANADPARVHMNLFLLRSCKPQNVALYAMSAVSLGPTMACDEFRPIDCSTAISSTTAPTTTTTTTNNIGHSTMTFQHLFSGNPDEQNASERLTEASFDVYLADPRDMCPGGLGPPPPCRGHLSGSFKFYFERGRPAQPFP